MSFTASIALVVLLAIAGLAVMAFRRKKDEPKADPAPYKVPDVKPEPQAPTAQGIDYSLYAGVSPYELASLPRYGHPTSRPDWDWGEWLKHQPPGTKDPRTHTNTGQDVRDVNIATPEEVKNSRALDNSGRWRSLRTGTYTMPNVRSGQRIRLGVSGAYGPVRVTLRDPSGAKVESFLAEAGDGQMAFTAGRSGTFTVDVDTGDWPTASINHWRD